MQVQSLCRHVHEITFKLNEDLRHLKANGLRIIVDKNEFLPNKNIQMSSFPQRLV